MILKQLTAKSAREYWNQYWVEIETSRGQASNVGDTQKCYELIPQTSCKLSSLSDSVRDVNCGFIADNATKVERWREHFRDFDLQPSSPLLPSTAEPPLSLTYPVSCDPPSEGEIVDVFKSLCNNKALGEDGMPTEVYKSCVDTLCYCSSQTIPACA
ncbi:unnamed protein product [Dibothriocephalus latus]|uniref:Reverse transcriptase domain-containing protein n=1 Tax=Dibothriocephalus latus TaxID=60516 RepID=A0A3P7MIB9_DIBLA|nr:unnamed protein product [Dibothriocephalus latus]